MARRSWCAILLVGFACRHAPTETRWITVPQNRRVNDGVTLALSYRRIGPPRPDRTIFHFTGGPGMSNLKQTYPKSLLNEFSLIEVGYRGVDSTPRLACDDLDQALTPVGTWGPEPAKALAQVVAGCFRSWQLAGVDLAGFQLRDVIDDAESVRRALGLGRVHLWADSYGTRVALYYQSVYPEAIGRTLLVGANPPGHFFWSAGDVSAGFAGYQPYFEQAYPQYAGRITLETLCAEALSKAPRRVRGMRLDPFRARAMAFVLLFHQRTSALALDSFLRAYEHADYTGLAVMSQLYDLMLPRAFEVWGDFFVKALVTDFEPGRHYSTEAAGGPGQFGSPLGEMLFGAPYPPTLFAFRDPPLSIEVRTPTLILAGSLDFSTPAANSLRELADRFPEHVVQVTVPDRGHVADFWSDGEAFGAMAARYFDQGQVPGPAAFALRRVAFRQIVGLSRVPVVLLAIAAVLASIAVWLVLRARRRRRASLASMNSLYGI